jgi:hypothetical protein
MTLDVDQTLDAATVPPPPQVLDPLAGDAIAVPAPPPADDAGVPQGQKANPAITIAAAALSSTAAAWMVAGMFRDFSAHLVALLGVVIGAGLMLLSQRLRTASWLEYIVLPVALLAGVVLVAPDSGSQGFTGVVGQALKTGGLLQPPISFDPGWRFILIVLLAPLTAGSARLALSLDRPKLGVGLPLVLALAAGIVQPASTEVASVAVAMVLVVVALTLAYGAELGGSGQISAAFEARRLLRGGAFAVGLAVMVLGLSNLGFLFPQPNQQHVIPPQKPPIPPPVPDQVLFNITENLRVPLRMGVIDIYDPAQKAWLLPPYDPSRFKRVTPPSRVPGAPSASGAKSVDVTVTVVDATGHQVPSIGGLQQVRGANDVLDYDPRTNQVALADKPIFQGYRYTLIGAPPPTGKQLATAGVPPASMAQFMAVPPPPNEVRQLLDDYAKHAAQSHEIVDAWDKLVFLRTALYSKVVAQGQGTPVDITATRVGQMLDGGTASPYEINAAEAMLARWAGLPSRIGYGYYGGLQQRNGSLDVHPVNAAMWLEVYFDHYGWIPIVGVPPRAEGSTSTAQRNNVASSAVNQLQLVVYIPVREPSVELLFEYVRWYLARLLPIAAALVLLVASYPWAVKAMRSRKRRAFGRARGPAGRIAVAYAEFRDRARDLAVGDPAATPLHFLRYVAPDREHSELAWLTSRALWGDLRRDLSDEDADAAERLASSVGRRLDRAQPGVNRVLARIARTSLREPFAREVPNLWPQWTVDLRMWRQLRVLPRRRIRVRALAAVVTGIAGVVAVSCGGGGPAHATAVAAVRRVPQHLVPPSLSGYTFQRERGAEALYRSAGADALVSTGRVYSIHYGGATEGAVQVALFDPDVDVSDIDDESRVAACAESPADCPGHEIFDGIQANLGTGHFQRVYYRNDERAYEMALTDERVYLWFPPGTETMVTLVVMGQLAQAEADGLFHALLDAQHGRTPTSIPAPTYTHPAPSQGGMP